MSVALIDRLEIVLVFVLGLSFGSFLNVVAERLPRGLTIGGRSRCPACFHELGVADLIPLLSFLALKTKCRYCRSPISWQYPLMELLTGLLFVFIFYYLPLPDSVFYIIFFSVLLILFLIDWKFGVVPLSITIPAIILAVIFRILVPLYGSTLTYVRLISDKSGFGLYLLRAGFFREHLILQFAPAVLTVAAAAAAGLFFYFLVWVTHGRGMGSGDISYAVLASLVVGFPSMLVVIFLSFFSGALISLALVITGKKQFGQTVPLGPFISFSTFVGVFWGAPLLNWYLNLLK